MRRPENGLASRAARSGSGTGAQRKWELGRARRRGGPAPDMYTNEYIRHIYVYMYI